MAKHWRREADPATFERRREIRAARKRPAFSRSHHTDKSNPYRRNR